MRSDDDMPCERFYELYRVLFYPGLHEGSAARMRDARWEQRVVRQVGPDDWKPLINEADMKRRGCSFETLRARTLYRRQNLERIL